MRPRGSPKVAAFDFLTILVVFFLIIALTEVPQATPPRVKTLGYYAVVMNAPVGNMNDVDLYVRDPHGHVAYYHDQAPAGSLMNLEHDVIMGATESDGDVKGALCDCERTIIRGIVPGEYIVDVHAYLSLQNGPEPVKVELWSLASGAPVISKTVILREQGDVQTAFRFTLSAGGDVTDVNQLPRDIVSYTG